LAGGCRMVALRPILWGSAPLGYRNVLNRNPQRSKTHFSGFVLRHLLSFVTSRDLPLSESFLIGGFDDGQIGSNLQIDQQLNLVFHLEETDYENRW